MFACENTIERLREDEANLCKILSFILALVYFLKPSAHFHSTSDNPSAFARWPIPVYTHRSAVTKAERRPIRATGSWTEMMNGSGGGYTLVHSSNTLLQNKIPRRENGRGCQEVADGVRVRILR